MRVVICLPDSGERAFCTRRINELSKIDGITLTIDEIKITEDGVSYYNLIDFEDSDLIYIGVNRDFDSAILFVKYHYCWIVVDTIFIRFLTMTN